MRLYEAYPELYDAIQAEWEYDRDLQFLDALTDGFQGVTAALDVGCGTGEHTCRLADRGMSVVGVDMHEGMLTTARRKCAASFKQATLPTLDLDQQFDLIIAIRGVINHLPPEALEPTIQTLAERLAPGGLLVFDNSPLPPDGNGVALDVGETTSGRWGRVVQMLPREDGRLDWNSIVFTPDGEFFVDTQPMTPFEDKQINRTLQAHDLTVETAEGYGPDSHRTVFIASRS